MAIVRKAPDRGYMRGINELRKFMGRKPEFDWHLLNAWEMQLVDEDFNGDALNLDYWAVANSSGASAADFAQEAGTSNIQGDTGTTDDGAISIVGPVMYKGDLNCGMQIKVRIDDPTEYCLELGFIDAVPGSNAPGVSDVDTPAATFTDGAVFHIDTDEDLDTFAAVTDGTGLAIQATTLAGSLTNLTAATWATFRVQLLGNNAYYWANGQLVASHVAAIEGGTAVAPWLYCATREANVARFPEIGRWMIWQEQD